MMFLSRSDFVASRIGRRGVGRPSQPWDGNNMDTYADRHATAESGRAGAERSIRRWADRLDRACWNARSRMTVRPQLRS